MSQPPGEWESDSHSHYFLLGTLLSRCGSKKCNVRARNGDGTFVSKKSTNDDTEICHFEEQYHGENGYSGWWTRRWRRNDGRASRIRKLSINDQLKNSENTHKYYETF